MRRFALILIGIYTLSSCQKGSEKMVKDDLGDNQVLSSPLKKTITDYVTKVSKVTNSQGLSTVYHVMFDTLNSDTIMSIVSSIGMVNKTSGLIKPIGALYWDSSLVVIHDRPEFLYGEAFYNKTLFDTLILQNYQWPRIDLQHPVEPVVWNYKVEGDSLLYIGVTN